jgi:N-acetyltransferase
MIPVTLQPVLRGELVELRPLRETDFDELFAVASDPLIWEQHPASDRYKEPVFRVYFREAMESGGAFAVIDRADGAIIGSTRYYGYEPQPREIEIGWTFLARACWGGRHNGEMKRLLLEHAFGFVDRVVFVVGPDNIRSRRAVEKIGGVRTEDRVVADGRTVVVYEITAAAYRSPTGVVVRPVQPTDGRAWSALRHALWPDGSVAHHASEIEAFFAGTLAEPNAVLVAEDHAANALIGFIELSLRAYGEGCHTSPVGYVEGWYVVPEWRRRGIGRRLMTAGEAWAEAQGCREFASDTQPDNEISASAHVALGFEEAGMIRCFRKSIGTRALP